MALRVRVIDLAKELGVTSKDLIQCLEAMGRKGVRTRSPLDTATANELRVKLGRGRALVEEPKPRKAKAPAVKKKVAGEKAPTEKVPATKKPAVKKTKAAPVVEVKAKEVAAVAPPPAPAAPPRVEVKPAAPKVEIKAPPAPKPAPAKPKEAAKVIPIRPAAPPAPVPPLPKRAPAAPAAQPPVRPAAPPKPVPVPAPREGAPSPPPAPITRPAAVATPTPPVAVEPPKEAPPAPAPPPVPMEVPPPVEVKRELIKLPESVTVGELASSMRRKSGEVIKALLEMGVMATVNEILDPTVAKLVADKFSFDVEVRTIEGEELREEEVDPSQLRLRSPVVTVMGHVDHGKTSLLDAIRRTKVAEKEFGGITQHIGAYQVDTSHGKVTFLDTPGHEAFTAMRARGAQATDIVILVVAADDGVMPQTVEAINHAKAAGVPIVVAVNKMDKPGADAERVKRELANLGLVPEEWGGQTIFVETSAKKGTGIDNLLEMTALQAEILELKANPNRAGKGVIIEGRLDRGRGPVATVLIQQGTLKEGDAVVVGQHSGRVRALFNDRGKKVKASGPSDPVEILGLSGVPQAGETLVVVEDERKARQIATVRQERERQRAKGATRVTLKDLHAQIATGEVKELRLILKADVHGSVEALTESLEGLSTDQVKLKVIHGSVGTITETDVMLASASNAIVLGFNVKLEPKAATQAQTEGVDLRTYNVIYEAITDVRAALSGLLAPEVREVALGKAQVRQLFPISKLGTIFGSYVLEGKIARSAKVRVKRDGTLLGEGTISSLRRFKDDVREVIQGLECGIGVDGVSGIKVGDVIEAYTTEEVARTL
ncbi:MAG: translation initiation factor IF-2 [Candidatus Rokubacteria bacterium]|nr:translation initiation factor IF-2 [Candidatus Rokubacteria bacterium]